MQLKHSRRRVFNECPEGSKIVQYCLRELRTEQKSRNKNLTVIYNIQVEDH